SDLIDEVTGEVRDFRIAVVVSIHNRRAVLSRQGNKFRCQKAVMTNLERVSEGNTVLRIRQKLKKSLEVLKVEFLRVRELPDNRSQLWPKLADAGVQKLLNRLSSFRQDLAVGGIADCLQSEDEIVRCLLGPFRIRRGFEAGVIGAVDFDGRHLSRGKL